MFATNSIQGISSKGEIRLSHNTQSSHGIAASVTRTDVLKQLNGSTSVDGSQPYQVTANMAGPEGFGGAASMSVNSFWNSQYQYMMTGILPADPQLIDTSTLALFFRDIYLFDNTAGSAVDIQSTFPFSGWQLQGLPEREQQYFDDSLAQLNLQTLMPEISVSYLVDGFFCASLVFDPRSRQFLDCLKHDALAVTALPSPFHNIDPVLNVRVSAATQQFINNASAYSKQYLNRFPSQFTDMLRSGAFTLDPVTTMFIGRKTLVDRAYVSYLHRILPLYLIEKTLFRGTLVEVARRQRAITHLTAGDDTWVPSGEELNSLVAAFQAAEFDPMGGWVSTRNAVQTVDVRPAGDFLKYSDMVDIFVPYKLRALGISEGFLTAEATFATAEAAYSTFLESQNAYRNHLTDQVFYRKLFPLIAVINGLMDDSLKAKNLRPVDLLFNAAYRSKLRMPKVHWEKNLEARGEDNLFEMLEKLSEKGVPIPMKLWIAAAGQDYDSLLRDLKGDASVRKALEKYTGKDTSHEGEGYAEENDENNDIYASLTQREREALREGPDSLAARKVFAKIRATIGGRMTTTSVSKHSDRVGLAKRIEAFSDSDNLISRPNKSGSGRHHIVNQSKAHKELNVKLARVASQADHDKSYRREIKAKRQRLGIVPPRLCL
jgi:hypothetical protein